MSRLQFRRAKLWKTVLTSAGIGSALVDAVANRDMPVVQALVLLIAGAV